MSQVRFRDSICIEPIVINTNIKAINRQIFIALSIKKIFFA